jgi:hypothetical protein
VPLFYFAEIIIGDECLSNNDDNNHHDDKLWGAMMSAMRLWSEWVKIDVVLWGMRSHGKIFDSLPWSGINSCHFSNPSLLISAKCQNDFSHFSPPNQSMLNRYQLTSGHK